MAGLWRKDQKTREGKYPVVLRRDGTVPDREWFVMLDGDPCAVSALRAYADSAKSLGMDEQYVSDLYELAEEWMVKQNREILCRISSVSSSTRSSGRVDPSRAPDPDAPPHRTDDPYVLGFPSSLREFAARIRGRTVELMECLGSMRDYHSKRNDEERDDGLRGWHQGAVAAYETAITIIRNSQSR